MENINKTLSRFLFLIVISMILFLDVKLCAQEPAHAAAETPIEIKRAIRYYPLNDAVNVNDIKKNKNGTVNGSVSTTTDRFGREDEALQIDSENTYVTLPNFFEGSDISKGYTVSFWIKVNDPLSHRSGADYPYTDEDTINQIIFARTGTSAESKTLFGVHRVRDRFVANRYVQNQDDDYFEFNVWFWDPANLASDSDDGSKWHFVTLVQGLNFMRIYVGKPDGTFNCRANYFPKQNLSEATRWGLGNPYGKSVTAIDDFAVFAQPLGSDNVEEMFQNSRMTPNLDSPIDTDISGDYYLITNEDFCLSLSTSGEKYNMYEDGDGTQFFDNCTELNLQRIDDESNEYSLRGTGMVKPYLTSDVNNGVNQGIGYSSNSRTFNLYKDSSYDPDSSINRYSIEGNHNQVVTSIRLVRKDPITTELADDFPVPHATSTSINTATKTTIGVSATVVTALIYALNKRKINQAVRNKYRDVKRLLGIGQEPEQQNYSLNQPYQQVPTDEFEEESSSASHCL